VARRHENSPTCTVWEHDHASNNLGYATALINGRYPPEKRVKNLECEENIFAISGSGTIHSEKGSFQLESGDSYHIERGEAYWIEGNQLRLGVANSPRWTPEQYRVVD
jgi:mannose-6-phosphate isomerase-like protein (cupin superfamily)